MSKTLPPLNWFRAFEASARNLSFTAAAEEIGMTQSAVSQQIRSLEMRLGVPLFERRARGLILTDHGRRLLPQVDTALETLSSATRGFVSAESAGLVTVSASISVIQWVIAPALPHFKASNPDISVRLISAVWPDEFSRTVADIEVRFGSKKQAGADAEILGSDRLIALKSPRLAGGIDALPLIDAVGTSGGWKAWGGANGYPSLNPSIFVDSYGVALNLAVHGNGACLVSEVLATHPLRSGQIEKAHDADLKANESYHLSVRHETPDALAFREWLLAEAST